MCTEIPYRMTYQAELFPLGSALPAYQSSKIISASQTAMIRSVKTFSCWFHTLVANQGYDYAYVSARFCSKANHKRFVDRRTCTMLALCRKLKFIGNSRPRCGSNKEFIMAAFYEKHIVTCIYHKS